MQKDENILDNGITASVLVQVGNIVRMDEGGAEYAISTISEVEKGSLVVLTPVDPESNTFLRLFFVDQSSRFNP